MAKKKLKTYRVSWRIDIEAESVKKAALVALAIQRDRESIATVFDVHDERGNSSRVDLTEGTISRL